MSITLQPVRKRQSYADVSPDDLAFALFYDRIAADSDPDAVVVPPVRPSVATKADPLSPAERHLANLIAPILDKYGATTVLAILNNEPVDLGPMGEALKAAILADLTTVALTSMGAFADVVGVGVDDAVAQTAASAWARTHAGALVQGVTETTQAAVQNAVATFLETPGMDRDQMASMLQGAFGRTRAETIAVTEVTRAASEGGKLYQAQLAEAGLTFERIWRTAGDDRACPICSPLDGKPESAWGGAELPAHPRCRCSATLRLKK
jgi:hypothetical protein